MNREQSELIVHTNFGGKPFGLSDSDLDSDLENIQVHVFLRTSKFMLLLELGCEEMLSDGSVENCGS